MVCGLSCSVAIVFIVAMIYFYSATGITGVAQKYEATLTPEKQLIYKDVVNERSRLAYQGYGLGLLVAALYIWFHKTMMTNGVKRDKMSNLSMVCIVISLMFSVNYFYYLLSPKKVYMLQKLKSNEEIKNWLEMYRAMQFNYHLGLLFGVAAAGAVAFAFRC